MSKKMRPPNVFTLKQALAVAEAGGYALGSFSPRYRTMISAVLQAGQQARSPLIVQISQKELQRYHLTPAEFADEFYAQIERQQITVPVVLHLDHTREPSLIEAAIAAGFTSVMIDASEKALEENITLSRQVASYAHAHGVSVEAELGRIGATDYVETDHDQELFTDPQEAERFVRETAIDALAVSVGTAHGVYTAVRRPRIDYDRLRAIRALTPVYLVLHGGSGVPAEMMARAIHLPGGGVSKVNIATDLELAALAALAHTQPMTSPEMDALSAQRLEAARAAVTQTVIDKMENFLGSAGCADDATWNA